MTNRLVQRLSCTVALFFLSIVSAPAGERQNLIDDPFPAAQAELRVVVDAIANDAMTGNVEGLQAAHLASEKFSKFGPRNFERQDVSSTNVSEAAFFGSISDVKYRANDLKIDVFGDVGIVTYYPQVSFVRDGEARVVDGRQTLVFVKTDEGWKIVHEHGTLRPNAEPVR